MEDVKGMNLNIKLIILNNTIKCDGQLRYVFYLEIIILFLKMERGG